MNGLHRSRRGKVLAGIALVGASALVLAGCTTGTTTPPAETGSAEETGGAAKPAEDLTLKLGSLLPATGSLAFLGAPMEAGVQLGVQEINDAGVGLTVDLTQEDEGDLDNKAYETSITNLQNAGITAMVGAASSSVTKLVIDGNAGSGILTISPSNTSAEFTGLNPLYFRTAPSDNLQGEFLGNQIAEDGATSLGIIYQNDPYGSGLAEAIGNTFESAGGKVVAESSYNQGDGEFNAQVAAVAAAKPDAVAVVSYDQFATIAPLLVNAGLDSSKFYLVDGNLKDWGDQIPVKLEGSKGTRAGADLPQDFLDQLNAVWTAGGNKPIDAVTYSAEAYDAVILIGLSALAAGSTEGQAMADKMIEVSGGSGDGEKCTTFKECADIILGGGTADYDGLSGDVTFDEGHDPTGAIIGVYEFDAENKTKRIK